MNGTENCDAQDFGGITCQSYGFDDGLLVCGGDCTTIDRAGCTGTENCGDGRDNDGDGRRDCLDSDCLVQCADSCGSATPIGDPATVTGDIAGRPRQLEPSCLAGQASGPERVYRFTAAATGVLEAQLTSGGVGDFSLSARGSCATPSTEFDCSERDGSNGATETVRVDVTQGQQVDLIVDGTGATATGTYTLTARTRPSVCGDLITDPSEECDDGVDQITGLPVSGDGCDEACIAEEDELESNGTTGTANAYNGFYMVARLYPLGDVDVFWFDVVANQRVTATVSGFGNLCADRRLDSVIELLSPAGAVLLTDDDGGVGYCSSLQSGQLPAGRYYVRVTGGAVTTEPVAYKLQIALGP